MYEKQNVPYLPVLMDGLGQYVLAYPIIILKTNHIVKFFVAFFSNDFYKYPQVFHGRGYRVFKQISKQNLYETSGTLESHLFQNH